MSAVFQSEEIKALVNALATEHRQAAESWESWAQRVQVRSAGHVTTAMLNVFKAIDTLNRLLLSRPRHVLNANAAPSHQSVSVHDTWNVQLGGTVSGYCVACFYGPDAYQRGVEERDRLNRK